MQLGEMLKTRFWPFIKKHKWSLLLVGVALIVGGIFLWDILSSQAIDSPLLPIIKKKAIEEVKVRAPLSGRMVSSDLAIRQPIGVVIENHPDARPQSGLNEAALIFETYAEGGITRFLAFYQEMEPKEIGPVRSAREYFVEWAKSYNAPFAHVGGSAEATTLISKLKVLDLNQFFLGNYFWRDKNRASPHNVYTTLSKLRDASKTKKYPLENDKIPAFVFKDEKAESERPAENKFSVNFNQNFAVSWKYNPKNNNYTRIMLGMEQQDRNTKEKIVAKNVVVMFTDINFGVSDISGQPRSEIKTTGTGPATFFIDGSKTTGIWKRSSQEQITRFFDNTGEEIKLNGGTTWVEVVPTGTVVN